MCGCETCTAGVIDSETRSMMSLSRCGVPDIDALHGGPHQRRHKRFVLAGTTLPRVILDRIACTHCIDVEAIAADVARVCLCVTHNRELSGGSRGGVQGVRSLALLIRVPLFDKKYVQNMSLMRLQCQ